MKYLAVAFCVLPQALEEPSWPGTMPPVVLEDAFEVGARDERVLTAVEGQVLTPEGWPASGAVVVSGAGGRSVTGADGFFRLELELPLETREVRLTAVQGAGSSSSVAHATLALGTPGVATSAGVLTLASGSSCPPSWLPTFGGMPGTDAPVRAMTVFDDGSGAGPRLYVGGEFFTSGGVESRRVACWDGASWTPLGNGPHYGQVQALAVFDAGNGPELYAATAFEAFSAVFRWDGTSWWTVGALRGYVFALAVLDDGGGPRLHAGGRLVIGGGTSTPGVARLDGQTWSYVGGSFGDDVMSLGVFDDGSGPALYAGGEFTSAGGVAANRIARWNGASWAPLGAGMTGTTLVVSVLALTTFDDGTGPALYAGGLFSSAGGIAASMVARWDGASWSALGAGREGRVHALTVFDDGGGPALYAGGRSASGTAANRIARWNGASWDPLGDGTSDHVYALASFDDGSGPALLAGGAFTSAGDSSGLHVARWSGSSWASLGSGLNEGVLDLVVFDDGSGAGPELYAAGFFTGAGGGLANHVARWDGSSWSPLGSGVNGNVFALAVFDDGNGPALYAAGDFTSAGGVPANRVARWNGASWTPLGSGMNAEIRALAVDDSGPWLYAGGAFTTAGGAFADYVARWNGASWSALPSEVNNTVYGLEVLDDGSGAGPALYAAGTFTASSATLLNHVARWNGSSWSALGSGLAGSFAYALAMFDDGTGAGPSLFVGGSFDASGATKTHNIARWNGASWSAVGPGIGGTVFALAVFEEGSGDGPALYAGGIFAAIGGQPVRGLARWDGASWSAVGGHTTGSVQALAVHDLGLGPALLAGGSLLSSVAGDSYLARWQGCADTTPPTVSCPDSVLALEALGSPPGELVSFSASASDTQDPDPEITFAPPSGSFFPLGTTLVTCTATDSSGNQASCQFPVTVAYKIRRP